MTRNDMNSLKTYRQKEMKKIELTRIESIIACLKDKVNNEEAITEDDKLEVLSVVEAGIDALMQYNPEETGYQE